ncbi:Uncharacterised protein [uncultured archaeon]|nr:Uncharacterised protein [uncultured archaeon]
MSELTVSQLVKTILAILVVVLVVIGVSFLFKNYYIDFIKGLPSGNVSKFFLSLI